MPRGSNEKTVTGESLSNPSDGHIVRAVASKLETTPIEPGLHLVATPIGNLADMTLRALATLARADVIACEDTRVTGKLKATFGITTSLTPYHEHNADRAGPALIERLKRGEIVALVSDAGTPLISDPGFRLVQAAIAEGVQIISVPGPSAALAALTASGLPTDRFLFAGFLPSRAKARRDALDALGIIDATLVIYESPNRLAASLADMADRLGDREAVIARELTKLHEEIRRGTLPALAAGLPDLPLKGEVVLVIAPPEKSAPPDAEEITLILREALSRLGVRDAATELAAATGLPRRAVYRQALAMREDDATEETRDS